MNLLTTLIAMQSPLQAVQAPVLQFPEAGIDDPAAYEGYTTRFFRDSRGNAFQIYLNGQDGRVVHVWADASNGSAAFTIRELSGEPARLAWGDGAEAYTVDRRRAVRHRLRSEADAVEIGWFVLGTMRQERDFQYWEWHRRPFDDGRFALEELVGLVVSLEKLPVEVRRRHLALLNAENLAAVRVRLEPTFSLVQDGGEWVAVIAHTSMDGRNRMTVELRGDASASTAHVEDNVISIRALRPGGVQFDVVATTDADALTPLDRDQIFNDDFDRFYARHQHVADSLQRVLRQADQNSDPRITAFRNLDRAVRGLELLSYEEKLMAALPNYATYFGRDMMMATLMMEPILSVDVQEHVIANVLRKLAGNGDVSHEEALGGQAIREHAAAYNEQIDSWHRTRESDPDAAQDHLARAREILRRLQMVRENHRMIDDDFQLPVLVDRYLSRGDVPAARMRRFLTDMTPAGTVRLDALIQNLALVAERADPYVVEPSVSNLVGFLHRDDDGWLPGSWRDSRVGYGNGLYAMDVNAVWVPKALEATRRILRTLETLELSASDVVTRLQINAPALERYLREPATLDAAITTWIEARHHFDVTLDPADVRARITQSLAELPDEERTYWQRRLGNENVFDGALSYLALSIDENGQQIAAANTDPATDLFLEDYTEQILRGTVEPETVMQMVELFVRPYPVGLFVEGLGPVVVNDVYARPAVKQGFRDDLYHSPRVVWGREVNLLLLGLSRQIEAAYDASGRLRSGSEAFRSYVNALRGALDVTQQAVESSGMRHNELWSYRIEGNTLRPIRYGSSSDIQLWNLTDLAVRFRLDRLPTE